MISGCTDGKFTRSDATYLETKIARVAHLLRRAQVIMRATPEIFLLYAKGLRKSKQMGDSLTFAEQCAIRSEFWEANVDSAYCEAGFFIRRVGFGANF